MLVWTPSHSQSNAMVWITCGLTTNIELMQLMQGK